MKNAILIVSYGGPERLSEVEPFLDSVLAGKVVPPARRAAIMERYAQFGGKSPLPGQARRFLELAKQFASEQTEPPTLYWGNLYSEPRLEEVCAQIRLDAPERLFVFPCGYFGAGSSCLRYKTATLRALDSQWRDHAKSCDVAFAPPFFDLPIFRRALADSILETLAWDQLDDAPFDADASSPTRLILFTAHSIPLADAKRSCYRAQIVVAARETLDEILRGPSLANGAPNDAPKPDFVDALPSYPEKIEFRLSFYHSNRVREYLQTSLKRRALDAALGFQSRSGSPREPWLEPSVEQVVRERINACPSLKSVVVVPIGFFFENMETIYDLDEELRRVCLSLNLRYRRAPCVGVDPRIAREMIKQANRAHDLFPNCLCRDVCDFSCRNSLLTEEELMRFEMDAQ